jgi:hypothetical protein
LHAGVELGAIMDLGAWLRSLGLEQYEATFRENAIDDTVLPDLTDQDLEKLGVLLGHRRKLLRAITNLENRRKPFPRSPQHLRQLRCRKSKTPRNGGK